MIARAVIGLLWGVAWSMQVNAQETEFLMIEKPSELVLLNRFEQNLSDREMTRFFQNVPLRVVRTDVLLSDRFTRAMQVELGRTTFYIQRRSNGNLSGEQSAGVRRLGGVRPISDTVETLKRGAVVMRQQAGIYLDAGAKLERFFEYQGNYFARHLNSGTYGWVELAQREKNVTWREVPSIRSNTPGIDDQIQAIVNAANRAASDISARVDAQAPVWTLAAADRGWDIQRQPAGEKWSRSDAALLKKIEGRLLGMPYVVVRRADHLLIRPR